MLQGKQLSRAVRALKLTKEVMDRLFFKALEGWLKAQDQELFTDEIRTLSENIQNAVGSGNAELTRKFLANMSCHLSRLEGNIEEFREQGRALSATFIYWDNFRRAVVILLRFLRAERDEDFELHLNAVCEAIPWLRAAGRTDYSKYAPIYVTEMRMLMSKNPDAYEHLANGGFVVRRSTDRKFNCVATDQALKQTINTECKSSIGILYKLLHKN